MAIRRYKPEADTSITNAYKADLSTRATGSNTGESDVLEVFNIYAQASSTSSEQSRILIKFPHSGISSDRTAGVVPASGSVSFHLRLFNVAHGETLPTNFTLEASPVTTAWDEGHGLDMEEFSDMGVSGALSENAFGGTGASWNVASSGTEWTSAGGDYSTATAALVTTATFEEGTEDALMDITDLVEAWIDGGTANHGIMVRLSGSFEGGTNSFYTKKFSARNSEYFFKRPVIEARWDSSERDDRNNFYAKSNLRSESDNQNVIAIKNYVDGTLKNISGITGAMTVKFYTDSTKATEITPDSNTMDNTATGVYRATVVLDTSATSVYAEWQDAAGTPVVYHTETIDVKTRSAAITKIPEYVTTIQNLKKVYSNDEMARFRLFIRSKDWSPTIYTVATKELKSEVVADAYFKIVRVVDDFTVVDYGSGTVPHTKLSYDENGPYFDFDMSMLETGWAYKVEFMYKVNGEMRQQPETFKFRVVE